MFAKKKEKKSRKNMKIIVNNGFIYWLYLTYDNTTIKIINMYIFLQKFRLNTVAVL